MVIACLTIPVTDDLRRTHEQLLRNALRHANLTIDQASREAEINRAQFTRQLQAIEGSLKRLQMLPADFWRYWALELLGYYGLPKLVRRAIRVGLAIVGLRQARVRDRRAS